MAVSRYDRTSLLGGGRQLATPDSLRRIQWAIRTKYITTKVIILKEGERLDHLAAKAYGNAQLWWVIAAASGIGWGLQAPPGTRIHIPTDLNAVAMLVQ
jgi:hypothetical protein